jgi:tetratricopeptide (TPR) repeat protein
MDNSARAADAYARLQQMGDGAWRAIGESGAALLDDNKARAMETARRAVAADASNPYAHYQAGIVASRQNNYQQALNAFTEALEIKPDLAYAHYYAGLASQRLKQTAKMSQHLEAFVRLAPEAPERTAVAAILRTLRG